MTADEYRAFREQNRAEMAKPKRCGQCQVAFALVPAGYCTYRQVPVWSPPEELPVALCFVCCPPDWGGASAARAAEGERLDVQDEHWDEWMREIERTEYLHGDYTDEVSPNERRDR
jgi:hypothetical protein